MVVGVREEKTALSASQCAGLFFPRQLRGGLAASSSSTSLALQFTPALLRLTPSATRPHTPQSASSVATRRTSAPRRRSSPPQVTRCDVAELVRRILCTSSKVDCNQLHKDSSLTTQFGFDHLDRLDVVMALEKALAVSLPPPSHHHHHHGVGVGVGADVVSEAAFDTPNDIVDAVCQRLGLSTL